MMFHRLHGDIIKVEHRVDADDDDAAAGKGDEAAAAAAAAGPWFRVALSLGPGADMVTRRCYLRSGTLLRAVAIVRADPQGWASGRVSAPCPGFAAAEAEVTPEMEAALDFKERIVQFEWPLLQLQPSTVY